MGEWCGEEGKKGNGERIHFVIELGGDCNKGIDAEEKAG